MCKKWRITPYRLRKWKKEYDFNSWLGGEEAWVTAFLYKPAGGATLGQLDSYLDWKNHCRYSDEEILVMLRNLEKKGVAVRRGERWYYNKSRCRRGTSFIF